MDAMHEDNLGILATLIKNPIVILCVMYGNVGALMYGFDNISLSLCLDMQPFMYDPLSHCSQNEKNNADVLITRTVNNSAFSKTVPTSSPHTGSLFGMPSLNLQLVWVHGCLDRFQIDSAGGGRCSSQVYCRS